MHKSAAKNAVDLTGCAMCCIASSGSTITTKSQWMTFWMLDHATCISAIKPDPARRGDWASDAHRDDDLGVLVPQLGRFANV